MPPCHTYIKDDRRSGSWARELHYHSAWTAEKEKEYGRVARRGGLGRGFFNGVWVYSVARMGSRILFGQLYSATQFVGSCSFNGICELVGPKGTECARAVYVYSCVMNVKRG